MNSLPHYPFIFIVLLFISVILLLIVLIIQYKRGKTIQPSIPPVPKEDHAPLDSELSRYQEEVQQCKATIDSLNVNLQKKDEIIDQIRRKLSEYEHLNKMKSRMESHDKLIKENLSLHDKIEDLEQEKYELMAENTGLEVELDFIKNLFDDRPESPNNNPRSADKTLMVDHVRAMLDQYAREDHAIISNLRKETWGNLRGNRYNTLTREQQAQIHFPILAPDSVFVLPSTHSFHSVPWCYALDSSKYPSKITLEAAIQQKRKPCSKCVAPVQYEDFLNRYGMNGHPDEK